MFQTGVDSHWQMSICIFCTTLQLRDIALNKMATLLCAGIFLNICNFETANLSKKLKKILKTTEHAF